MTTNGNAVAVSIQCYASYGSKQWAAVRTKFCAIKLPPHWDVYNINAFKIDKFNLSSILEEWVSIYLTRYRSMSNR